MSWYAKTVAMAAVWVVLTGSLTVLNVILGLALGLVIAGLLREQTVGDKVVVRLWGLLTLTLLFFKELILSAWKVARLVTSPTMDLQPGIFAYPLKVNRDFEITLLANLITLTPGTLSVDVSADRRLLFVHAIDCSDVEQARRDIEMGFERKILEAFH